MNIVFDFGGVVFQWHPPSFLARLWPQRDNAAAVRDFFQGHGGDWGAFDQGLIGEQEVIARISARTGWPLAEVAAVVAAVPAELQLLPDTAALIEELKAAGHRLFFLSNMPAPLADHLECQHPLARWFENGVFSSRVKTAKPMPEIFALAADRFGLPPAELLLLDDHPANVEAARACGWQAILFTTAADARPQLLD